MRRVGLNLAHMVLPNPFYHQTCFAHCLDLAVRDTLPTKKKKGESTSDEDEGEAEMDGCQRCHAVGIHEENSVEEALLEGTSDIVLGVLRGR